MFELRTNDFLTQWSEWRSSTLIIGVTTVQRPLRHECLMSMNTEAMR